MGHLRQRWLLVEFLLLFVAFPLVIYVTRQQFKAVIIPALLLVAGCCTISLLRDQSFDRQRFWNAGQMRRNLPGVLKRFLPCAVAVAVWFSLTQPERLFDFPNRAPRLWLLVMLLYPLVSVYPQEIIFRTFFFQRYRLLFRRDWQLVCASGIVFGLAHLFFANQYAPVMTTVGGWFFAKTYAQSESTLAASLEHGLWGDFIFTLGLGWYFYGGSIG